MCVVETAEGVWVRGVFYADAEKTKRQKRLERLMDAMWEAAAPEQYRAIPINRDSYKQLAALDFEGGADNLRYDTATKRVYVGCGDDGEQRQGCGERAEDQETSAPHSATER